MAKKSALPERYYEVKISLKGARSSITICAPAELSLERLAFLIVETFGEEGDHLCAFPEIDDALDTARPAGGFMGPVMSASYSKITLEQAFKAAGDSFTFIFDFGSECVHTIDLEIDDFTPEEGKYPLYLIKARGREAYGEATDDMGKSIYGKKLKAGDPRVAEAPKKKAKSSKPKKAAAKSAPAAKASKAIAPDDEEDDSFDPLKDAAARDSKVSAMPERYFKVKIQLKYTRPTLYRVLCVPAELSLRDFCRVIREAIGWGWDHLDGFPDAEQALEMSESGDFAYSDQEHCPEYDTLTVQDLFGTCGPKVRYVYDYGDYHEHIVQLQDADFRPEAGHYPIYCLKSQGPHPFEDGVSLDDKAYWDDPKFFPPDDEDGNPSDEYFEFHATLNIDPAEVSCAVACVASGLYGRELHEGDPCVVPAKPVKKAGAKGRGRPRKQTAKAKQDSE